MNGHHVMDVRRMLKESYTKREGLMKSSQELASYFSLFFHDVVLFFTNSSDWTLNTVDTIRGQLIFIKADTEFKKIWSPMADI